MKPTDTAKATRTIAIEPRDDDSETLSAALAQELALDLAPVRERTTGAVRSRLLARVRDSAQAHQDFITVRRDDTPWADWQDGVRARMLHAKGALRMRMLELRAGAALPDMGDAQAQELLVLRGTLVGMTDLAAQGFLVRTLRHPGRWTSAQGALVYVRELCGARDALPAAEARWWPAADAAARVVPAGSVDGWLPFSPGVQVKPLAGDNDAISMLARFEPGARVNTHGHCLDEDCVMLEGDLFLGDVLLREHEYQLAPAGTTHLGLFSDVGAVLYFHGAIDPALRGGG
jgi:hypothetical protein